MKKILRRAVCLLIIGILTTQGPMVSAKADVVDGDNYMALNFLSL